MSRGSSAPPTCSWRRSTAARRSVAAASWRASPTACLSSPRRPRCRRRICATATTSRSCPRVTLMRVRGHRWTAGALPPFSLSAVAAVRRAVAAARPDVLNVHYAMPTGLAGVVAVRRLGVPTVLTMNGRDVPGPGVPALWRWWQRALIAMVSEVTYVSGYCRDAIYGAGRGPGEVITNGVEVPPPPGHGAEVRAALEVPSSDCLVFALQRLAPEKRVDVLLHALRRCLDAGA